MPEDEPETVRRGHEVYERQVKSPLRAEDDGRFVAVDATTGEYEVDEDDYAAVMRLRDRCPAADIWLERAGFPTAHQMMGFRCSAANCDLSGQTSGGPGG